MSDQRYTDAVRTFMCEAESLTQEQLDVLTTADENLGKRATSKRHDALQHAAEVRHQKALGEQPVKLSRHDVMAEAVLDAITLALVQPRTRIKALETLNATLEQRCNALETRLFELEAREAMTHADR
jgi:hypothetical protein